MIVLIQLDEKYEFCEKNVRHKIKFFTLCGEVPIRAFGASGESLSLCMSWRCPNEAHFPSCRPKLCTTGRSLPSIHIIVEDKGSTWDFGCKWGAHNTTKPYWPSILAWRLFAPTQCHSTATIFISHIISDSHCDTSH